MLRSPFDVPGLGQQFAVQGEKAPSDLLEVLAEKLTISGQTLVELIAELKSNAIVNDFGALNRNVALLDAQQQGQAAVLQSRLTELQQQLQEFQVPY